MNKTYRVALVGTGGIADAHVRAVASLPNRVKLVAACDIDPKRAQDFCTRSGIPTAYTDYAAMLKTEQPDLVLIAAPPATGGTAARGTIEFLTAIYKSAFTGGPVTRGSIQPGDPFYAAFHGGMAPKRMTQ